MIGLRDLVSTQLSFSGYRTTSPTYVKTLNGLTFSTAEAYGWSINTASVYGSVIISSVCCTFALLVPYANGT